MVWVRSVLSKPSTVRVLGLIVALLLSAILFAGAFSLGSLVWDEHAEVAEIEAVVTRIAAESAALTDSYFSGAETSADYAAGLIAISGPDGVPEEKLLAVLAEVTTSQPNVAGAYVGFPDGSFTLARRSNDSDSQLVLKRIVMSPERTVTETVVDIEDLGSGTEVMLADDIYDPRSRPWYKAVTEDNDVQDTRDGEVADVDGADGELLVEGPSSWSDPYVFFSSRQPGITYSRSIYSPSTELVAVVGIDVELAHLSAFLTDRRPTDKSHAIVSNEAGTEIARSRGSTDLGTGDSRSVAVASQMVTRSKDWTLTVEASHDDFLPAFREQRGRYQTAALGTAALVSVLMIAASVAGTNHITTLRVRASTDHLTGLLNRRAVLARVGDALARHGETGVVGLLVLDLDGFKMINDTYGHAVGDGVLVEIARRANGIRGDCAVVGRLGGDEFCAIYVDDAAGADLRFRHYADQLMHAVFGDPVVPGADTRSGGSAGLSTQTPGERKTVADLFSEADTALYVAKEQMANPYAVVAYEPAMEIPAARDLRRKSQLAEAIGRGEFLWHFQPEVNLITNRLVGAEALLRWQHPVAGECLAEDFIGDIERLELLPVLLPAMVEAAIDFVQPYRDLDFSMRLNVAQAQLRQPDVTKLLAEASRACPATTFCIEITERVFLSADEQIAASLNELRRLGIQIVLDDFGTGFSSLRELHTLPVDGIKIDKDFVAAIDDADPRGIVAMMVSLGTLMGLEAVAEGIENPGQAATLVDLGCVRGQGYLFGAALPAEEFWAALPPQQAPPNKVSVGKAPMRPSVVVAEDVELLVELHVDF